jgi:hypothetical protein
MEKIGKHYKFRDQEFWAQNGLIYQLDYRDTCETDERFTAATRAEFAARIIALNDQAKHEKYADEREELFTFVEQACKAVKEAKHQGDPMDPEAAKQVAMENKRVIIQNNYKPDSHSKLRLGTAGSIYNPPFPPPPKPRPDAHVAGKDSAPDGRRLLFG